MITPPEQIRDARRVAKAEAEARFDAKLKKAREQHAAERHQLRSEPRKLRRQNLIIRSEGFKEGSASVLSALYSVAACDAVRLWISDMLMSARRPSKPQNHLTPEQNNHIVSLIEEMLARNGLSKVSLETDDMAEMTTGVRREQQVTYDQE